MKKYFVPVVAIAILAIIMASSFAMGTSSSANLNAFTATVDNAAPSAVSGLATLSGSPAAPIVVNVNFNSNGSCAIFWVKFTGYGVLQVDTYDYGLPTWPDYWRATITVMYAGQGKNLTDTVSSNVGRAKAEYTGLAEMPVFYGLNVKVLISWDRGNTLTTTLFPAGVSIRFRYSGPSMTVTGPLPSTGFT